MIKAVIFDMGGVILRTVDAGEREALAERLGTTRRELEKVLFHSPTAFKSETGELSVREHWDQALAVFDQPPGCFERFAPDFFGGDVVDPQLIEYIHSLKQKYQTGLLSNAWTETRETMGSRIDFDALFNVSVFSAEVGLRKPDERIYKLILEKMGVEAQEAIFLDDFPENIAAAEALGIQAVQFRDVQQAIKEINQLLEN